VYSTHQTFNKKELTKYKVYIDRPGSYELDWWNTLLVIYFRALVVDRKMLFLN
jgi:hypothetical protein